MEPYNFTEGFLVLTCITLKNVKMVLKTINTLHFFSNISIILLFKGKEKFSGVLVSSYKTEI